MEEQELVTPFFIDDGELEGETEKECFALGVEIGRFIELLRINDPFSLPIHYENIKRIERISYHKRIAEHISFTTINDDHHIAHYLR